MFTLAEIKNAHGQMRSGADFPIYIAALKELGVTRYITFVEDGHTEFDGENGFQLRSPSRYEPLVIEKAVKKEQFLADLKTHQQGKTDYLQFCEDCARAGVVNWVVRMKEMTCTYYGLDGDGVLVERIPDAAPGK